MGKEVKTSTVNGSEVLRVVALFVKEINERELGDYFEDEFVRDGWGKDGGAFWIFDGPHEDVLAEVLEEIIPEVEELKNKGSAERGDWCKGFNDGGRSSRRDAMLKINTLPCILYRRVRT